jgi:hypothetical protein
MSCPIPRTRKLPPVGRRIAGESSNRGANRGANKEPKSGEKPSWPTTQGNILARAMEKRFGILADPSGFARVFSGVNPKHPVKSIQVFQSEIESWHPMGCDTQAVLPVKPTFESLPCSITEAFGNHRSRTSPTAPSCEHFPSKGTCGSPKPKTVRLQRLGRALK